MTLADTPATFDEYRLRLGIDQDHPGLADWQAVWQQEREAADGIPQSVPACPSWCDLPQGHAYDSWDGYGDGLHFLRTHEARATEHVTVDAQERNHGGGVTLAPATAMVDVGTQHDKSAIECRALAAELLGGGRCA